MRFAVIDIGSNTVKLNIYRTHGKKFDETDSFTERAALASYKLTGSLSDDGVSALISVIRSFSAVCGKKRVKRVFPYATQSLRGISNTEAVLDRVKNETGYDIEIIPGEEEARLGFKSFISEFGTDCSGVLADMGGGSTELTVFDGDSISYSHSLPFGSLSLAKETGTGVIPDEAALGRIRKTVRDHMEKAGFSSKRDTLYATGGTASGALKLCREYGIGGKNSVSVSDLKKLLDRAMKDPAAYERRIKELMPERYDSVFTGIAAYITICESAAVNTFVRSKTTCRYGYAAEIFEKRLKK